MKILAKTLEFILFLHMLRVTSCQVCKWVNGMTGHGRNKTPVGGTPTPEACALMCASLATKPRGAMFASYEFDTSECYCLSEVTGIVKKEKTTVCQLISGSHESGTGGEVWIGRSLVTTLRFTDKSLAGHVIRRRQVSTSLECFLLCLQCIQKRGCRCRSVNISHGQVDGKHICELNDATQEAYPYDLVQRVDFQHYAIE